MLLSPNHRRSLGIISVAGHKLLVFFLLGSPKIHTRPFSIFGRNVNGLAADSITYSKSAQSAVE